MSIVDFMIHLQPELPWAERSQLESEIGDMDGVMLAHFSPRYPHMMEVAYNPDVISLNVVLERVSQRGISWRKKWACELILFCRVVFCCRVISLERGICQLSGSGNSSSQQRGGDLRHVMPLETGHGQFVFARFAAAIGAGNGAGAIGGAAADFAHGHLPLLAIG